MQDSFTACPTCKSPRQKNKTWPVLKLSSKFAELIASKDSRERLMYRYDNYPKDKVLAANRSPVSKVYDDIFDSAAYAAVLKKRDVDNPLDIYFNLNIDGFQSKVSSTKLVIIHCVVLNYSPVEVRDKEILVYTRAPVLIFFFYLSVITMKTLFALV